MASLYNDMMQQFSDRDHYFEEDEPKRLAREVFVDYPVYDISNIVPLFKEMNESLKREIPKRPPHRQLFAEWRVEDSLWKMADIGSIRYTYIMLLVYVNREELLFGNDFGDVEGLREAGLECDEFYTSVVWKRYDSGEKQGKIYQENHQVMYCFRKDSKVLDRILTIDAGHETEHGQYSMYGFPWEKTTDGPDDIYSSEYFIKHVMFVAFSLLHCKNIKEVDVDVPEALQSARRRRGKIPLYGYKVLKLNVPIEEQHRVYGVDTQEGGYNRFHMVRGHFKNLQHERYLNKGLYWWPAHWRGDPDRGLVEKDYKIDINHRIR